MHRTIFESSLSGSRSKEAGIVLPMLPMMAQLVINNSG